MTRGSGAPPKPHAGAAAIGDERHVLIVGAARSLPHALEHLDGATVTLVQFRALDARLLARVGPDVVLAPLFSTEFDITDLAERLEVLGYRGALRAFTRPLPEPRVVLAEVRIGWPKLDFDLIVLPPE